MQRLYVLVRNDIDVGKQCAQALHAMYAWVKANPDETWNNEIVVALQVPKISKWMHKLDHLGEKYTTFAEPWMNDEITSLVTTADQHYFRNLKKIGE